MTPEKFGVGFALGVLKVAGWLVVVCFLLSWLLLALGSGMDDTDSSRWNRSGVSVVTDHKTGLQYLRTPGGGITPRLGIGGEHVRADQNHQEVQE